MDLFGKRISQKAPFQMFDGFWKSHLQKSSIFRMRILPETYICICRWDILAIILVVLIVVTYIYMCQKHKLETQQRQCTREFIGLVLVSASKRYVCFSLMAPKFIKFLEAGFVFFLQKEISNYQENLSKLINFKSLK